MDYVSHRDSSIPDKDAGGRHDPLDIADPVSAYFFLSDDAQDEISRSGKKRMKCLSCGHRFMGKIYDSCPECFSLDIEEAVDEKTMDIGDKKDEFELGIS